MATKIQLRRDTAANWTANNPTLASGEAGYETDTGKLKLGDGTTAWTSLAYYTTEPSAHALGGAEHSADTLANLNSKISDATLIDTGDSRLSDARTPTAHTHPLADVTDSGALAAKNTVATADVDNDAITYAKMQNVSATDRILGRDTAGAGDVEEITPAALRTMINVADGATANDTDANLKARANHTGTQTASTISDFDTEVGNHADVSANTTHRTDTANPHSVTKAQVGLGNVEDLKVNLAASTDPGATDDSGAGYAVGSRWINTTLDKEFVCLDSTATAAVWTETTGAGGAGGHTIQEEGSNLTARTNLNFIGANVTATDNPGADATDITITGGGGATDLASVQARRTTTYAIDATWTALTFEATDLENDATVVKHNDTTTSRIDVLEAGIYEVEYYALPEIATSDARVLRARLYKNGSTVISGSEIDLNVDLTNSLSVGQPLHRKVVVSLSANDYVEVKVKDDTGTGNSINTMATLIVTKLEGVQGAVGPAGADGDITWQGAWVSQNYVVNQAVQYQGSGYVCKLNTVSSEVPTNTTYWDLLVSKGDVGGTEFTETITTASHNGPDVSTASATYVTYAKHVFRGSTELSVPTSIKAVGRVAAGTGGGVRVYDVTNSQVICELTGISGTSDAVLDLGTISNVSAGAAVWELQIKGDATNLMYIATASIKYG